MGEQFRIAVDIDGVLYNWDAMVRILLLESPWTLSIPYPSPYWNFLADQLTEEQNEWLWTKGVDKGMFRRAKPFKGAIAGVKRLAELGQLVLSTSRPERGVPDTLEWIAHHRLPVQSVHFCGYGRPPKSSVEAHVYIDDGAPFLRELAPKAVPYSVDIADAAGLHVYTIKRHSLVIGWRTPETKGQEIPHVMWTNNWEVAYQWISDFKIEYLTGGTAR